MAEGGHSRDDIRLAPPDTTKLWDRLETWHKGVVVIIGAAATIFGAGIAFQRARATIVTSAQQKVIDQRQDQQIRAVQDDSLQMHVTMDDLHDEVRGMRTDLRYFDPRQRGGGLPSLPEETPRPSPTPTFDPSMGLTIRATPTPKGTP